MMVEKRITKSFAICIRMIESSRMRWVMNVTPMGERRNAYNLFLEMGRGKTIWET